MKTLSMIRFKPKPNYFDDWVTALKNALKGHEHYVLTRDDEVFQIWVTDAIEDLADFQHAGLTFWMSIGTCCRNILLTAILFRLLLLLNKNQFQAE